MPSARESALRLAETEGLGHAGIRKLLTEFGTPVRALAADPSEWEALFKGGAALHRRSTGEEVTERIGVVIEMCRRLGIEITTIGEAPFPNYLANNEDPPPVLYTLGSFPAQVVQARWVAVVGTRKPTDEGLSFAYRMGADLARAGAVVVSGLAMGIDGRAHEAVVDTGGIGVAVLPCGLDRVYPEANRKLAKRLLEKGCLVSEMPPGARLNRGMFVGRNRIISGLASAVVIIEAGEKSGAVRTAEFGLEQGRAVFVMPGRPSDPKVAGSLAVLKRIGAAVITEAADLEDVTGLQFGGERANWPTELATAQPLLAGAGVSFDDLLEASGLSPTQMLVLLGRLELTGRLRRGSDGLYYAVS